MNNNEQHTIDTTVRQALENLEIPFKADHWELMVSKLDALDAKDADFDKNLASKLASVKKPYVATHWDLMASKLDALNAKDTDFDKNLAHKLTDLEVPFVSSHWLDMSDRLDELDNVDTSFDALLRQRLDNVQPNMPKNHWELMEERLEETFSWRRKIVRYKVVEVALVLLTLFTVGNTLDLPFDSVWSNEDNNMRLKIEQTKKSKNEGTLDLEKATPQKAKETKSFYNPTDWRNRPTTPIDRKNTEGGVSGKPIVSSESLKNAQNSIMFQGLNNLSVQKSLENTPPIIVARLPTNQQLNPQVATVERNEEITTTVGMVVEANPIAVAVSTATTVETPELPLRTVLTFDKVRDDNAFNQNVASIAGSELSPVDILKPSLLSDMRVYDANIIFPVGKEKKAKTRINVFGLPSMDWVTTNSIQKRTLVKDQQRAPNLGAGVAVAYKKGKWEFETGLSYLDKKYDLPNVEVTTGNLRTGFNTVKLQNLRLSIASIPLSVNYVAKESRRWRFYARGGTALNAILKSDESKFATTDGSSNAKARSNFDVFEPNTYPKGITEKGLFNNSKWLNGGLKQNTYLTANVGVGIEYRFTTDTDIYLQPTADYHFGGGIGTLNDRIHSFSVQGGVKKRLK